MEEEVIVPEEPKKTNWFFIRIISAVMIFILVIILIFVFTSNKVIKITEWELLEGKEIQLNWGEKVIIIVDGKEYFLNVDSTTLGTATTKLTDSEGNQISSEIISTGGEMLIDINKDGVYDLQIKLEKIEDDKPYFNIKKVTMVASSDSLTPETDVEVTCAELGGNLCEFDQLCSGQGVRASDGSKCCLNGTCSFSESDCIVNIGELASEGCDSGCSFCDCTENNGGNTLAKTAADWSKMICLSEPGKGANYWHNSELNQCPEGFIGSFYGSSQGPCICGDEYCGISYVGGEDMNYCKQGICISNQTCPIDSECYYDYMKDILNDSCGGGEIDLQEGDRYDFEFDGYNYYILIEEISENYANGMIHTYGDFGDIGASMAWHNSGEEAEHTFQNRSHRVGTTLEKTYGSLTRNHPNACISIRKINI